VEDLIREPPYGASAPSLMAEETLPDSPPRSSVLGRQGKCFRPARLSVTSFLVITFVNHHLTVSVGFIKGFLWQGIAGSRSGHECIRFLLLFWLTLGSPHDIS